MPFVIAPLVDAAFEAVGAGALASTAIVGGLTVGGLVANVLFAGALVGVAALLQPKKAPSYQPWQPYVPVATQVNAQSIAPRFHVYGQMRVGGVLACHEVYSLWLWDAVVLNCGPIAGVLEIFNDDELQVLTSSPLDGVIAYPMQGLKIGQQYSYVFSGGAPVAVPGGFFPMAAYEFRQAKPLGNYSSLFSVSWLTGLPSLTNSFAPIWAADILCAGLSMLYCRFTSPGGSTNPFTHYPNRLPQVSCIIQGEPVYDPRDPAQNFADQTTWKYSSTLYPDAGRNPALIWAAYWTHGDGGRLAYSEIDWASVARAANDCDRLVGAYGGGTEPFARCEIQWHTGESPADVETRILATCDGVPYENGGKQALWIHQPYAPVVTLTEQDFSSIQWDEVSGALDETNYIQASYSEPRINYAFLSTAPATDATSIAQVGERPQTLELKSVTSHNQAYRLAYRALRRNNPALRVTASCGPRALRALEEFAVAINAPDYGIVGTFRPRDLVKFDPATFAGTYAFDLIAADEYVDVVAPYDPVSGDLSVVSSATINIGTMSPVAIPYTLTWVGSGPGTPFVTAEAWTYQVLNGNSTSGASVGLPIDTSLQFFVQARTVASATDRTPTSAWQGPWTNATSEWLRVSPALAPSTSYELQAWFLNVATNILSAPIEGVYVDIPAHA